MVSKIKGTTIYLIENIYQGLNAINEPIYKTERIPIDNVLIAPVASEEALTDYQLQGYKTVYQLAIPKADTHTWTGGKVEFYGKLWDVVGEPLEGLESMLPLDWNKKVKVKYAT